MNIIHSRQFSPDSAWDALDITTLSGETSVRLHWTDTPYKWHINDGEEVFVVVDGAVDMHYKDARGIHITRLETGDIFHASEGTEHVAHPVGEARILVIEKAGSV